MQIPKLVKIWYLLQLLPGNENTDGRTADGQTDGHMDYQRDHNVPQYPLLLCEGI